MLGDVAGEQRRCDHTKQGVNNMHNRIKELVICSPGNLEAPGRHDKIDPKIHFAFWTGSGWSPEYPDALTWAFEDCDDFVDDNGDFDEDLYEGYLELVLDNALQELKNPEIPKGSYIERGYGYGASRIVGVK